MSALLIAELGSNPRHANGWDWREYVVVAKSTGADAVKIQLFQAEHFPENEQAEKRQYEFPRDEVVDFAHLAHLYDLQAGASVFDVGAVNVTLHSLDFLKLAAREQYNQKLNAQVALACIARPLPYFRSITTLSDSSIHRNARCTPFFCIPQYPANLWQSVFYAFKAARYFKQAGTLWGWSSHTTGWLDCAVAVALGATVVEKHFALNDSDVEGGHSLQPKAFTHLANVVHSL